MSSISSTLLFNLERSEEPNASLMPTFIDIFVSRFSAQFAFLDYETLVGGYLQSTLCPALANVVASLTVPFAGATPALAGTDLNHASQQYMRKAKEALSLGSEPSIEELAADVLICNIEWSAARRQEAQAYAQRSFALAAQLGLTSESSISRIARSPEQTRRLLALSAGVSRLGSLLAGRK